MKRRISFVIGHTEGDKGATIVETPETSKFAYRNEYDFNVELSYKILEALLPKYACFVAFRDGLGIKKTYDELQKWGPSANIELHFNGHKSPRAFGTEVLCTTKSFDFALILQRNLCNFLGREGKGDRGVKIVPSGGRGYSSVSRLECPNVIIEPFFGTNESDALLGLNSMDEIAMAIRESLNNYFD